MTLYLNQVPVGGEEAPPLCGNFSGTLLVVGSGHCLWDDLARLNSLGLGGDVMAVNFASVFYPGPVHHLASLHPLNIPHWIALRWLASNIEGPRIHTHAQEPLPGVETTWRFECGCGTGGTSSLFAVLVGLALGYERVILAGVPLDNLGHFYDPPGPVKRDWQKLESRAVNIEWECARETVFHGRVKSMSGMTKAMLGEPT